MVLHKIISCHSNEINLDKPLRASMVLLCAVIPFEMLLFNVFTVALACYNCALMYTRQYVFIYIGIALCSAH